MIIISDIRYRRKFLLYIQALFNYINIFIEHIDEIVRVSSNLITYLEFKYVLLSLKDSLKSNFFITINVQSNLSIFQLINPTKPLS